MQNLEVFRDEVRGWLDENCPASMRTPMDASEQPGGVVTLPTPIRIPSFG